MHAETLTAATAAMFKAEQCQQQQATTFQLRRFHGPYFDERDYAVEETDATRDGTNYSFQYHDIASTAFAIISRLVAIYFNIKLALDFHQKSDHDAFVWTIVCLCVPLVITSAIHCYMYYEDGKFKRNFLHTVQILFWIIFSAIFLRYFTSLVFAISCKRAENRGDRSAQIRLYKLAIREESDVAFLKLFECFLEVAPQKILQISIVLSQQSEISHLQIIVICLSFGSMAWCLAVYNRYIRYAQADKFNINACGHIFQLCWHFCTSISRTLTISFVASIFPLYTLLACLVHAVIVGIILFLVDRPACPKAHLPNFLFCLVFGFIYLFTYIALRDESTFYKYVLYYASCLLENCVCIFVFATFASEQLKSAPITFYALCSGALAFYALGIVTMILYYSRFHPRITARNSASLKMNNK